ncbi:MAG: 50S ribosomal protein L11 methyltransferase [Candidatus Omnitrophica bacterium]|nr:50S ribosomal protein L11 methyltransferase [Candidatus Omnitrophota bacterium]
MAAMFRSDLSGMRVIDAGAGEGILSLVAYKLGASFVELIEIESSLLYRAGINLELNGLKAGIDFQLVRGDLNNAERIVQRLSMTQRKTAIVSDIGSWPRYSASNIDSINLLSFVPNVTLVIAGGYRGYKQKEIVDRDMEYIAQYGFEISNNIAIIGGVLDSVIAWTATKQG